MFPQIDEVQHLFNILFFCVIGVMLFTCIFETDLGKSLKGMNQLHLKE